MNNQIRQIIYNVIDHHPEISLEKSPDTPLIGEKSSLESISLVSMVIDIESEINLAFNTDISLMDEKAFSLTHSPFKTIGTLIDHLVSILGEPNVQP